MKKLTMILVVVGLVLGFTSVAGAACSAAIRFSSWDADASVYNNVYGYANDGTAVGAFWEVGSRSTNNEGTSGIDNVIRFYPGYGGLWLLDGSWANGAVSGCTTTGANAIVITQGDGSFVMSYDATPDLAGDPSFVYGNGHFNFAPIPLPVITGSSNRNGTDVTMDIQVGALDGGFSANAGLITDAVSHINLYRFHGATPPGNDASAWTFDRTLVFGGGTTSATALVVSCLDDGGDTWLAAGIKMTNEYDTVHVSAPSTRIECDPTLADPDDKFDIIRERGQGQKKGRPFSDR